MSDQGYQDNYVDVLGDDNLFRIGRVVDIADNGLFVDFCPKRRQEFAPFNRIFQVVRSLINEEQLVYACGYGKPHAIILVDALMREAPSGPWTWFPAGIISLTRGIRHKRCSVAVVEWFHGQPRTDLVPLERLRWRVSDDWWATIGREPPAELPARDNWHHDYSQMHRVATRLEPVRPGIFEKRSVPLPKECRHIDTDNLLRQLNGRAWRRAEPDNRAISFVNIHDGNVSYIWRRPTEIEHQNDYCFDLAQNKIDECRSALTAHIRSITWMLTEGSAQSAEREETDNVRVLTSDVMLEVFSHLDTCTLTRLRTVCAVWSGILESPELSACIVVTASGNSTPSIRETSHYFLMAPVFKCLRPSTQHMVVDARNSSMDIGDFLRLTDMIHYVGQTTGSSLRTLHVVGLRIDLELGNAMISYNDMYNKCKLHRNHPEFDPFASPMTRIDDFISACDGLPCDAMHLVNCTFNWEFYKARKWAEVKLAVDLSRVRLSLNGDVDSAMWDALEKCVPKPSAKDLRTLSMFLAFVAANEGHSQREWCNALCATQSADPRLSSHYRGKEWCADGLKDLRLEKLSSIALYFLVEVYKFVDGLSMSD
ncbi:uncharacterized protein LOC129595776 [Paramacrobiotus metropolitanus]|uniref:uncharacterized protein LOC129595776 n=1 Tax=Paramacrobiotus metropolitanus TaxID=2943436 RepID=UPI002445FD41|nr:uncharacterized protein LOC129595776 [Paramacrobiotus metropolitanus]XP_055348861.1 uncharacterized protein LOC129595776 [Paramacrobiotus metropolitanus]